MYQYLLMNIYLIIHDFNSNVNLFFKFFLDAYIKAIYLHIVYL